MANEAVIVELLGNGGDPIEYTVADGVDIPKGSIMQLTTPRTASISSGAGNIPIGIAASQKVANDGSTTLAIYTNGIFDLKMNAGETATVGELLVIDGVNNLAKLATTGIEPDDIKLVLGTALETAGSGSTIQVRVNL